MEKQMILFRFPQKKIILDCFSYSPYVLETAPIVPAMKLMPEWWKKLPNFFYSEKNNTPQSTMRTCDGMVNYYKKSIAMPMWSDLSINVKSPSDYSWQYADEKSEMGIHDVRNQATGFLNGYAHLKLMPPWKFKCKEDIFWVWSHPVYNYPNSHHVVSFPGIVSYKEQYATNINLLVHADKPRNIVIPHGQTLVHMTPMSDRKVEIVRHLVTREEFFLRHDNTRISFLKKTESIKKAKDRFKDCPFHNHI